MRLENLFYDVTSSLRYTLKGYSNCKFRIFNGKISLQKFTKSVPQGSNIINHISLSSQISETKIHTLSQIFGILKPDNRPSSFEFVGHVS